jgi:hypothetical protein
MNVFTKKFLSFLLIVGFFLTPTIAFSFSWDITEIKELEDSKLSNESIQHITKNLMLWLLSLITILSVISFIVSGVYFILGGASGQLEVAKNWLKYSIIGLIVALSGYIIINLVYDLSKANITDPSGSVPVIEEEN